MALWSMAAPSWYIEFHSDQFLTSWEKRFIMKVYRMHMFVIYLWSVETRSSFSPLFPIARYGHWNEDLSSIIGTAMSDFPVWCFGNFCNKSRSGLIKPLLLLKPRSKFQRELMAVPCVAKRAHAMWITLRSPFRWLVVITVVPDLLSRRPRTTNGRAWYVLAWQSISANEYHKCPLMAAPWRGEHEPSAN